MRVVLFQPLGFDRETPADSLTEALAVPRIHFGSLLRTHVSQGTELGIRAAKIIESGRLFPDEIITEIVRDHLHRATDAGFLFVGYPHRVTLAPALDELLRELGQPLDGVLRLRLPEEEKERHVRRRARRRLCRDDRTHTFEPSVDTLLVEGVCNACGGELHQGENDSESSIRGRFESYEAMVEPVAQHYARQDLLVTVDAVGTSDETAMRGLTALREHGLRPT
ncbi:adenylate kinase family protein [Kitasatospora sp. NPDC056783]|uniref:adenylate kinase family protein n=1 Tax=Kitasatospora sp. NPDC056783 TaxID=3345943 RepID=UPI0036A16F74